MAALLLHGLVRGQDGGAIISTQLGVSYASRPGAHVLSVGQELDWHEARLVVRANGAHDHVQADAVAAGHAQGRSRADGRGAQVPAYVKGKRVKRRKGEKSRDRMMELAY